MRFHLLGVGSIGSLFATHLSSLDAAQVRLILRRKDLAAQLLNPTTSTDPSRQPLGTIKLERDGLVRKTTNLEMELTRNPADMSVSQATHSSRTPPKIDPSLWLRNDPIDTLIVTTKAPQTLPALRHILPRLSSRSTIVLCQNGMGTLEGLLEKYWPEDRSDEIERERQANEGTGLEDRWRVGTGGGRPSFICATTTHGAWRKGGGHFVHAGMGDLKFGLLPNRAVLSTVANYPNPPWSSPMENPILNPRSLVDPVLEHLPLTPVTSNLHTTISSLLSCPDLKPAWLPLPVLETAQLQKLAVNASVNSLTALMGVNNGALIGSQQAKRLIDTVSRECASVFAAHIAREEGRWTPPAAASSRSASSVPLDDEQALDSSEPHPAPPALPKHHALSPESLLAHTLNVLFKTSSNLSSTLSDLLPLQQSSTFTLDNAPSLPTRTEIEFINGYVTALGSRYGIETPVVKALGEMVLLKEEMGRVGAIDRVWEGRRKSDPALAGALRGATSTTTPRPSIFSSPSSSSASGSDGGRRRIPEQRTSHKRAEKYDRIARETQDRARQREIERIQRERGHDEGG
ncbi:hypothetical protein JCM11491_002300 [Sporobolomyces phaffii]